MEQPNQRITADVLRKLSPTEVQRILSELGPTKTEELQHTWEFWARDNQLEPAGKDWNTWLINAGRGNGKAIDVRTPILTKDGWTEIGQIKAGDVIYDENGDETTVLVAHEPFVSDETYEVSFSDGQTIVACKDHLWVTLDAKDRKRLNRKKLGFSETWANKKPITTKDIFETQAYGKRADTNHCIPLTKPIVGRDGGLLLDPYCLGYWLGDGHSHSANITTMDKEVVRIYEDSGYPCYPTKTQNSGQAITYSVGTKEPVRCNKTGRMLPNVSFQSKLVELDLLSNKHIPKCYLKASFESRLFLLQGLVDSDGYVKNSYVEFCTTNKTLADNFLELARGLGEKPRLSVGIAKLYGKDCGPKYRITYRAINTPCRISRKVSNFVNLSNTNQSLRNRHRMITSVKRVDSTLVRCLTVDSKNSMFLIGRGLIPTHNTRAGVEWVRGRVKSGAKRIAAVAATNSDIERVMVKGESGFLNVCWKGDKTNKGVPLGFPEWSPTKRSLVWANGAQVQFFSAEEPERLRGPQFENAWCDELAAWNRDIDTWDMLQFCMRLGRHPRIMVTTTPKPTKLVRKIIKDPKTIITTGSTFDNSANLAETYLAAVRAQYEGTRLGRQELYAEVLEEAQGALWTSDILEQASIKQEEVPELRRIVVAVDPAVTSNAESDMTGIVVAGVDINGKAYVLGDYTDKLSPQGWAAKAVALYHHYQADRIVAERNQGGEMVRTTIQGEDENVPIKLVHASRGKYARAEPVSALYERSLVKHVVNPAPVGIFNKEETGSLNELETQMRTWEPLGSIGSPDRLDALVWAITDLCLKGVAAPELKLVYESRTGSKGLAS